EYFGDIANIAELDSTLGGAKLITAMGGYSIWNHHMVQTIFYQGTGGTDLLPSSLDQTKTGGAIRKFDFAPLKSTPCFSAIQILDPTITFGGSQANMASILSRHMPSSELSRCVPHFRLRIMAPGHEVIGVGLMSTINSNDFLRSGVPHMDPMRAQPGQYGEQAVTVGEPAPEAGTDPAAEATPIPAGPIQPPKSGMELFTMPQTIVPVGQPNNAFRGSNPNVSVDPTRPFMTVKDFSISVTPTRGALSTQKAKLSLIVHDRRRLPQLKALLSPALMNKIEFEVEWGWSHPDGGPTSNNVIGKILNSAKDGGVFGPTAISYSFDDAGQVNVNVELVTKGAGAVAVIDAAMTGRLSPMHDAVRRALDGLAEARSEAGEALATEAIQDLGGTAVIESLSLSSTGQLLNEETMQELNEWVSQAENKATQGMPSLGALVTALGTLQSTVNQANAKMQEDLEAKINFLKSKTYFQHAPFNITIGNYPAMRSAQGISEFVTAAKAGMTYTYNWFDLRFVAHNGGSGPMNPHNAGEQVPLGALLQLFLVQPLAATGMYDDIQLVTYTANTECGFASGANLAAIPIDMRSIGGKSFLEILKAEYETYGGQYSILSFINFLADNFIAPQMSVCYGLASAPGGQAGNSNFQLDPETGAIAPK
ncbi:MAG TPA: hypothetical protein DEQ32_11625, partial [Gammaproteobacteria bacterium]|nr:hypothetical protein [Gammaproteobacteria bacterium]